MSGLGKESRRTNVNTDYLWSAAVNPLLLKDSATGQPVFQNSVPGSSLYVRPVSQTYRKDSQDMMIDWVKVCQ